MLKAVFPVTFAVLMASPALALDPGGSITGTIGGQPVEAVIWADQSDYSDYGTGGKGGSVSLMVNALSKEAGFGTTAIGIEAFSFANGPFDGVDIRILTQTDPVESYSASLDSGLALTLDEAVMDGEVLKISGTLEGTVMRGPAYGKPDNPSDTLPISLHFDAVVPLLE